MENEQNENIDETIEKISTDIDTDDIEKGEFLNIEDISQESDLIFHPKVDDSIEFIIQKLRKLKDNEKTVKTENGKIIGRTLSSVDYGFVIITNEDKRYIVQSWEVWGKIKAILRDLKKIEGVRIRIKHVLDGRTAADEDKYEVSYLDEKENSWIEQKNNNKSK